MSIQTQKTLEWARKQALSPWMVERFIGIGVAGRRVDYLNIIDIIGIDQTKTPAQFWGIQSTSLGQKNPHLKILLEDQAESSRLWLSTGSKLFLVCWRKVKKKKKDGSFSKVYTWEPKIDEITLDMLKFKSKEEGVLDGKSTGQSGQSTGESSEKETEE